VEGSLTDFTVNFTLVALRYVHKLTFRPVTSLLITGLVSRFPQILDLFQGLNIGVPSGCLGETSNFKIIMIKDVTLWSKLKSTC